MFACNDVTVVRLHSDAVRTTVHLGVQVPEENVHTCGGKGLMPASWPPSYFPTSRLPCIARHPHPDLDRACL